MVLLEQHAAQGCQTATELTLRVPPPPDPRQEEEETCRGRGPPRFEEPPARCLHCFCGPAIISIGTLEMSPLQGLFCPIPSERHSLLDSTMEDGTAAFKGITTHSNPSLAHIQNANFGLYEPVSLGALASERTKTKSFLPPSVPRKAVQDTQMSTFLPPQRVRHEATATLARRLKYYSNCANAKCY